METAILTIKVTPEIQLDYKRVAAIIAEFKEVVSVHLISGVFDLCITVNCVTIEQVGKFVSKKLSTVKGITSVSTHFVMETYKQNGEIIGLEDDDDRGLYSV
jgi:DNA-binding Lrp family transcriptional regulator